jgi:hypothetical protein
MGWLQNIFFDWIEDYIKGIILQWGAVLILEIINKVFLSEYLKDYVLNWNIISQIYDVFTIADSLFTLVAVIIWFLRKL